MTTDATHQENEQLRNVIKQLRRKMNEQRDENQKLRAKLKACKDMEDIGTNTTAFIKALEERNLELERWKDIAQDLAETINTSLEITRQYYDETLVLLAPWIDQVRQAMEQTRVPILTEVIYTIASKHHKAKETAYEQSLEKMLGLFGTTNEDLHNPDPFRNPLVILMKVAANMEAATINHNTVGLLSQAHGYANDPRFITMEILQECWRRGEPSMLTLRKLSLEWIEQNLPNAPKTRETLQKGLRITQHRIREELNLTEYHKKFHEADSALRRYESWRHAIEQTAFTRPNLFKASSQPMP